MSKDGRTYRVVSIVGQNASVLQNKFDNVKALGVIETSLASCRRSNDDTKMILKYRSTAAGNEIASQWPPPKVLFEGNLDGILAYLATHKAEWENANGSV